MVNVIFSYHSPRSARIYKLLLMPMALMFGDIISLDPLEKLRTMAKIEIV